MVIYVREPARVATVVDTGMKQDIGIKQSTLERVADRDRWDNGAAGVKRADVLGCDTNITGETSV